MDGTKENKFALRHRPCVVDDEQTEKPRNKLGGDLGHYQHEVWRDLFVMLGTSAAALLGLLFVATSLHLDEITKNFSYRNRALNNSYMLIFTLVEAIIVLTPQPIELLSATLVVANLVIIWIPLKNTYLYGYKNRDVGQRGGWAIWRGIGYLFAITIGIAGGALTLLSPNIGLYLITVSCGALLVIVALNSWSVLLGIGQMEQKTKS
jgi:hypothetical protein